MKVMDLLVSGGTGGIESLLRNYSEYTEHEHIYICVWGGGINAERMRSNGKKVFIFDKKNNGTLFVLKKILDICKQEKVDVIISHHSAILFKLLLLYIKRRNYLGLKTIAYIHSNARDFCKSKNQKTSFAKKILNKTCLNSTDTVIAISESVKRSLINFLKVNDTKIKVVYNGIPVNQFLIEKDIVGNNSKEKINLIYVGRLIPEKGVQIILRALSELPDFVKYHFDIVGEGIYRETLEWLSAELNLKENVTFCGSCDNIADLLSEADIFIHMPIWEEGFGITVVEALAAGKICVCANSGAMSEIIQNNRNGYLVKKGDYLELADKLTKLYMEMQIKSKCILEMRKNAILRAQDFTIEKFTHQVDIIIEGLCK